MKNPLFQNIFALLKIRTLKALVSLYYHAYYRLIVTRDGYRANQPHPYILLANHSCLSDPLMVTSTVKDYLVPVVNEFIYANGLARFAFQRLIHAISKKKGGGDISVVKGIKKHLAAGRGIVIFPEGTASLFGETDEFVPTTARLCKHQGVDVFGVKIRGGSLAQPRWAVRDRFRPRIFLHYFVIARKEELPSLSTDALHRRISEGLSHNDYEWNREESIPYHSRGRLEGVARYLYVCPECSAFNSMQSVKHTLFCSDCDFRVEMDLYGFLRNTPSYTENLPFDNLVAYSHFQKEFLPQLIEERLEWEGELKFFNPTTFKNTEMGRSHVLYQPDKTLTITYGDESLIFEIQKMKNLSMTLKRVLSFIYDLKIYSLLLDRPIVLYDMIKYLG